MDLWEEMKYQVNREMKYRITLVDVHTGTEIETGVVDAVSPMDAIHSYGFLRGWKPEHDSLDWNQTRGHGYMDEDSGTRILVYEI